MSAVMDEPDNVAVLALGAKLNRETLSQAFRTSRRLRVVDFLAPASALALYRYVAREVQWRAFLASNGRLLAPAAEFRGVYPPELERQMLERAYAGAGSNYAFLCEMDQPFPEDGHDDVAGEPVPAAGLLGRLGEFVNSAVFLDTVRDITGSCDIRRARVRATRYRVGHFATFNAAFRCTEKWGRPVAAFTLNLTPEWAPEWGGLLEFHGSEGYVVEAYVPSFNVLDIFALPQGHWVSPVAPFASGARLAIEGRLYALK
jgi:SM-20-related protein